MIRHFGSTGTGDASAVLTGGGLHGDEVIWSYGTESLAN